MSKGQPVRISPILVAYEVALAGVLVTAMSGSLRAETTPPAPYQAAVTTLGAGETPASIARFYARDPQLFDLENAYLEWPVPAADRRFAFIDGKRVKASAAELVAIAAAEKGRSQYWGRISGTESDMQTRRYVEARFRALGLADVRIQELLLPPQWRPKTWSVSLQVGADATPIETSFPMARCSATGPAGLTGPIVWLGLGTEADFLGRDVRGKIALIYSAPQPNVHGQTAVFENASVRAERAGAIAVLIALDIPGNVTSQMARTGDLKIPGFTIGRSDGLKLRHAIETTTAPQVTIHLEVQTISGLTAANVWGVLHGNSDENVLITAHTDSYFGGAVDNASGVATMLELARYFASVPKIQRKRNIVFVATGGHHEGSPGTHYIHDRMQPFLQKTALLLNAEHTAVNDTYIWGDPPEVRRSTQTTGQTLYSIKGSAKMQGMVLAALKSFGVGTLEQPEARVNGDVASLFEDAPTIQLINVPLQYHTDADTMDLLPWPGLANVTRAYAKIITELDKIPLREIRTDGPGPIGPHAASH
ncbi:MAG: M28 family metallopeptidase [Pseudomonadota bacterium]|nr:M28 family metallopeptidase [Pseudomonadota bacterium]